MTVREWFRRMRATGPGADLACQCDDILSGTRRRAEVYGVYLLPPGTHDEERRLAELRLVMHHEAALNRWAQLVA